MKILYKGKEFVVYNPGELLVDETTGRLLDQLSEDKSKLIGYRKQLYLMNTYSITPEDYYIIVVLYGDESLKPTCKLDSCNNIPKFNIDTMSYRDFCCRSHVATYTNLIGMANGTNRWIITNRENWINPFSGKFGSELSRSVQLRLVDEGRHPWSGERGSKLQREKLNNGTHPFLKRETEIKGARRLFELKGSPDDKCYFYIAEENKNPGVIKIGVTSDISKRKGHFGNYYNKYEVILTDTRMKIAEVEFLVKMNFIGRTLKGDEYFSQDMKSEILDFVNSLYK